MNIAEHAVERRPRKIDYHAMLAVMRTLILRLLTVILMMVIMLLMQVMVVSVRMPLLTIHGTDNDAAADADELSPS